MKFAQICLDIILMTEMNSITFIKVKSIAGLKILTKKTNIIGELKFYSIQKELTDLSKNQLALYFYNNSNNVAILLPQRAFKRRKPLFTGFFHGCEIIPTQSFRRASGVRS